MERVIKMKGGRIINSGQYGAVIYPGIPCNGKTDHASKVFFNQEEEVRENDEFLLSKLKEIDPLQKRFIYVTSKEKCSEVNSADYSEETKNDLQKLRISVQKSSQLNYVNMPFLNHVHGVSTLTQPQYNYLNESLDILHSAQISHGDIHAGNILVGKDEIPRIIDFGSWSKSFPSEDKQRLHALAKKPPRIYKRKHEGKVEAPSPKKLNF